MKVAILSTTDITGGASKPAYNLHCWLNSQGVDSRMFVQKKYSGNAKVIVRRGKFGKLISTLIIPAIEDVCRRLFYGKNPIFYSPAVVSSLDWQALKDFDPDVVNIHWTGRGHLSIEGLANIKKPIVWTFHDMWPFCGGEHYVGEDDVKYSYINNGEQKNRFDVNCFIWWRKKRIIKKLGNFFIVTPSYWLANKAKQSSLFRNKEVSIIPYGLDTEVYKSLDRHYSRRVLNLPADKKIILFGASSGIDNPRKGFDLLAEAINQLPVNFLADIVVVVFGPQPDNFQKLKFPVHFLGKISDEYLLPIVYSAADVFAAPSRQDNLPNTVMESLACGVPVAAFNVGGIADMVEHKKNGYLAEPKDVSDLAQGIEYILTNPDVHQELSRWGRSKCEKYFSLNSQGQRYLDLFRAVKNK